MQLKQFAWVAPLVLACASALPVGEDSKLQALRTCVLFLSANKI